jgi:translocation and assembly module TamB
MEGSQIFFRGNQFAVSQALLEFKDRHGIDPVFDLHAQSQVREYLVILHGFGRLRDPQLILSSDPGLGEADILSLLTLGVTSRDQSSAMGTTSVIGEAVFNASGLDRQIQRFLPKSPLLRDLNFHVASSYNEASGLVEPTAQLESRFLTEHLKLQMFQPVVTNRGTRAQAEYRFHDRLSGQLQWDNDAIQDLPNFGVDLKLKWEVE